MGQRILVVDDEPEILEVMESRLKAHGYTVVTAMNGVEAAQRLKEAKPALIILDIMMPGLNGLQVLEIFKTHSYTSKIPIIMVTSKGETSSIFKAEELKAADYLIKPFKPEELLELVERYI